MIFLSRLLLDSRDREVRRDLADCHRLHSTVLGAFPISPADADGEARAHFGVLYRVETGAYDSDVRLLVQSHAEPDWSRLPRGYLRDDPACKRVDEYYAGLTAGTVLIFRLRANPTKRISEHNETQKECWRGKRVELRDEESQMEWLHRKGEQGGFVPLSVRARPDVPDVRTIPGVNIAGRRPGDKGRLSFGSVLFEGRLRVTDADLFRRTLEAGIGSGKAYGFGLLSIAPAQEQELL
jgi:CRISPR system Cascade subunit CasE